MEAARTKWFMCSAVSGRVNRPTISKAGRRLTKGFVTRTCTRLTRVEFITPLDPNQITSQVFKYCVVLSIFYVNCLEIDPC